jgi:hypothetical protein
MTTRTPNPGSLAAIADGCTCPTAANGHGRGIVEADGGGFPTFTVAKGCRLHDEPYATPAAPDAVRGRTAASTPGGPS